MSEAPVLFDIDLNVPLQEFDLELEYSGSPKSLGVFGVSGSGKTPGLECLAGLKKFDDGRIVFDGEVWLESAKGKRTKPMYRNIGYVPQDYLLFPKRDVISNLESGKKRLLENGLEFEEVFGNAIETLELQSLLDRRVELFSGGERQRVALGRALCSGPSLLLLDEPLASLDSGLRRKILSYLVKVRYVFEIPMVVVSHNPIELQALCDEILVISEGKLITAGPPNRVFTDAGVFELAKEGGFENVFNGRVLEHSGKTDIVCLESDKEETCIRLPVTGIGIGDKALFSIASHDLMLSLQEPVGLSARNCLRGWIVSISDSGSRILSRLSIGEGGPEMIVELTQDAVDDLKLAVGSELYAIFKTNSVRILV
ncbi:MAG: ATP-binding cassette domain-containing protein [Opitutales bacterium]|nr:ATP-binding cassette domain-containing protein [Opitutales bacterium]